MNKIDLLFNYYKDDVIEDCKKFKTEIIKKFKLTPGKAGDLYTRIINYQIDEYGEQIGLVGRTTYADYKRKSENAKRRKQARRKSR